LAVAIAAVENALLLAEVCSTVTLVHRGKALRARREFTERLQTNHCANCFQRGESLRIASAAIELKRWRYFGAGAIKPFQMAVGRRANPHWR